MNVRTWERAWERTDTSSYAGQKLDWQECSRSGQGLKDAMDFKRGADLKYITIITTILLELDSTSPLYYANRSKPLFIKNEQGRKPRNIWKNWRKHVFLRRGAIEAMKWNDLLEIEKCPRVPWLRSHVLGLQINKEKTNVTYSWSIPSNYLKNILRDHILSTQILLRVSWVLSGK